MRKSEITVQAMYDEFLFKNYGQTERVMPADQNRQLKNAFYSGVGILNAHSKNTFTEMDQDEAFLNLIKIDEELLEFWDARSPYST